jgi:hypothetical protein
MTRAAKHDAGEGPMSTGTTQGLPMLAQRMKEAASWDISQDGISPNLVRAWAAELEAALNAPPAGSPRHLTEHQRAVEEAAGMNLDWGMAAAYEVGAASGAKDAPSPAPPDVEAIDDREKVKRALDALDDLCDIWAQEVDLERIVVAISGHPDKVRGMLRQCWIEGAYRGRTSHLDYPNPATAPKDAPSPAPCDDEAALSVMPDDVCPDCTLGPPNWAERKEGYCSTCNDTGVRPAPKDALREALERLGESLRGWRESHSGYNHVDIPDCTVCDRLGELEDWQEAALEASRGVTKDGEGATNGRS